MQRSPKDPYVKMTGMLSSASDKTQTKTKFRGVALTSLQLIQQNSIESNHSGTNVCLISYDRLEHSPRAACPYTVVYDSAAITHYVIIYDVPGFSVHFDACAFSVYQAVFSPLPQTAWGRG